MKRCRVIFALFAFVAVNLPAQTVYTLTPNTKGNQIELSVANRSAAQAAKFIEVKAVKHPLFITYSSAVQTINTIAPEREVSATFTFDVGRPGTIAGNDTLEFQIQDASGLLWTKEIVVNYATPQIFRLEQNYPNPFNPTTTIEYQLPTESRVSLKLYDVLGREVATLVNEQQPAGYKETKFNAANYASGVYFCRMVAQPLTGGSAFSQLKKLMVVK